MSYNPKVSIIIPVYNGANYLGEAIDSALSQTYENKEIIVINDGSKDDGATEKVALSYGDKIRYIPKENGGVSSALNTGIKNATGEWISWLSHDDIYTEDKVEKQVQDVAKIKETEDDYLKTLYYCEGGFMNAQGKTVEKNVKRVKPGMHLGNDMLMNIFSGYGIGGCGLLMPKKMFDEVGFFDETMRYMQDVFMWEKAFLEGYKFFANPSVMSITRVHSEQVSTKHKEYGLVDREKVGKYLSEHLVGIKDSDDRSVLKEYMYLCMRNNSTNIGNLIYGNLKRDKNITLSEKAKVKTIKMYGFLRKRLVKVYYKVRFGAKR